MRPIRVAIVGGGLSGISQAIQLRRQLGSDVDITVFEKEEAAGGTWLNSTWPGAGVDIPIHLYSLYSDPKSDWDRVFAEQREVLEYLNNCIEKNGLSQNFVFRTTYLSSEWDAASQTHTLTLQPASGPSYTHITDILISANGPLCTPLLPSIPGVSSFRGAAFHNLHWRKHQPDLANKKVAVIGNGSSGIQLLPGVAKTPGVEVVQYTRSGGYYFPKVNAEIAWWQKAIYRWVPGARWYHRYQLFKGYNDRWKARNMVEADGHDATEQMLLDYLRQQTPPEYLEALTPKYPLGCKRPAYDAGWLAALHLPNVSLNSVGIREITDDAIVDKAGGTFKPDVIIYATGSDVGRHGVGLNIGLKGEGGKELREYWEEIGGPQSYMGLAVPGFPNYFITIGPNAIAGSWGFTIGNQTTVIARLIKEMVTYDIGSLQPRLEAFEEHNRDIQEALATSTMNSKACVNWWRVGGQGRPSVPNPLDAVGLWRATRTTRWEDWLAIEKAAGGMKPTTVKDVRRQIRRKQIQQAAFGAGVAAAVAAVWYLSPLLSWHVTRS
ncbi:hypothetical protein JCM24511_07299 [Saitozyma sp. JCM 24511]|nr:hypothetical protein JCM24511_07299 [Saitozyma sp. JCM 24511]